ncbi:MAG: hypothetical protein RID07_16370 [Lacipirellulaceae bacterium]
MKEGTWAKGNEQFQAVYDGQTYRFSSSRNLAIFAASPQRYAPVLGGDCVASLAETNQRTHGKLQNGIVYDNRLFFFKTQEQLEQFNAAPNDYRDLDLAASGNCPVTLIDSQQELQGNEKSETVLNGWRFRFAGTHQRRKFLSDAVRYQRLLGLPSPTTQTDEVPDAETSKETAVRRIPAAATLVAEGYCLVTLLNTGDWSRGREDHSMMHQGQKYLFATDEAKTIFADKPAKYAPACLGLCPVTLKEKSQRTAGSIHHLAEYQGLLYLLAGEKEKQRFLDSPERYLAVAEEAVPSRPTEPNTSDDQENPYELTRRPSLEGRWSTQR